MTSKYIKIIWSSIFVLLSIFVGAGISVSKDGSTLSILTSILPLGSEGVNALAFTFFMGLTKWINPILFLCVGMSIMDEHIQANNISLRFAGFLNGIWLSIKECLFYTQLFLLPFFVFAIRFFSTNDLNELLITNGVCILIGIQYLIWYTILIRLVKHSGLSIFLVLLLAELSSRGGFLVDFGEQMGFAADTVNYLSLLLPTLPILFVSMDIFNPTTSLIALGVPIVLAFLVLLIPLTKN